MSPVISAVVVGVTKSLMDPPSDRAFDRLINVEVKVTTVIFLLVVQPVLTMYFRLEFVGLTEKVFK